MRNRMRNRSFSAVLTVLALLPGNLAWGQANLPNNPNAATVQGPDPTGMLGYPLATVPATGALNWPVAIQSFAASVAVTQGTSPWVVTAPNAVSTLNSTAIPLGGGGIYTGAAEDVSQYQSVSVFLFTDAAGGAFGLAPEWSNDGINWTLSTDNQAGVKANVAYSLVFAVRAQFFRVLYQNGANPETVFRLQVVFHSGAMNPMRYTPASNPSIDQAPAVALYTNDTSSGGWKAVASTDDANVSADGATSIRGISTDAHLRLSSNQWSEPRIGSYAEGQRFGIAAVDPMLFDGSNDYRTRTPTVFKAVATAAVGNTALWTPAAGKKFRLMRWRYTVTGSAATAGGADIVVTLFDGAAGVTGQRDTVTVPAAATTLNGQLAASPWIDLGNGYLSSAANNVLNINLSVALSAGTVTVEAVGTEE